MQKFNTLNPWPVNLPEIGTASVLEDFSKAANMDAYQPSP